ncbi:hypothetical protein FRB98_008844 [Tulasnella sp. 332]|nr:hypothetical protein FRB98_008844 [Tulasnella sp. 332]
MFSAFRSSRPPHVHHPASNSSHTASSSGSASVADSSSSGIRSPLSSQGGNSTANTSGWESDVVLHPRTSSSSSKAVRWNASNGKLKMTAAVGVSGSNSNGYSTDAGPVTHSRSRTYSNTMPVPIQRPPMPAIQSSGMSVPTSNGSAYSGDELQGALDRLLRISSRAFAFAGTVPIFAPISTFFQTLTGSCHLIRFPNQSSTPSRSFDAFLASCEPVTSPYPPQSHSRKSLDGASQTTQHLTYRNSPNRPITTSFELSSYPILDTVKRTLFPTAPEGVHLVSSLNRIDIYCPGAASYEPLRNPQQAQQRTEHEPVAHVIVTLPMRFRGGVLSVAKDGNTDTFWGRGTLSAGSSDSSKVVGGGGIGNLEWVAYLGNGECDYVRVDKVESGVRVHLVYDVCLRSYGPYGVSTRPLMTPNDNLLSALSSVLKRSRGMKLGFYLTNEYGISPAHVLAESLVPLLKGTDLMFYSALKYYNLAPQLRYTIVPGTNPTSPSATPAKTYIYPQNSPALIVGSPDYLQALKRLKVKSAGADEDLAVQIEEGGAVSVDREGVILVNVGGTGSAGNMRVGRERLAFLDSKEGSLDCE